MDDTRCRQFFNQPTETLHRRYEALRAFFVEQVPYQTIAQRFGISYHTIRSWVRDFRAECRAEEIAPFFCDLSPVDHRTSSESPNEQDLNNLRSPTAVR